MSQETDSRKSKRVVDPTGVRMASTKYIYSSNIRPTASLNNTLNRRSGATYQTKNQTFNPRSDSSTSKPVTEDLHKNDSLAGDNIINKDNQMLSKQKQGKNKKASTILIKILLNLFLAAAVFLICYYIGGRVADRSGTETTKGTTKQEDTEKTETETKTDKTEETAEYQIPECNFVTDLSAYEEYMNPTGEDRDKYLILVNRENAIGEDYIPEDLVNIINSRSDRTEQMVYVAEKALEALFIEAEANGMTAVNTSTGQVLSVMSGYRSYQKQLSLFETYVQKEMESGCDRATAEATVKTYSNPAGTSEHQTGLCVDMHNLSSADQSFQYQDAAKWLEENCWKFGYILRYPADKEDITGTSYEPWHFRFVGRYHAAQIYENNLCLEEYLENYANE